MDTARMQNNLRRFFVRGATPVTFSLMAAYVVTFVAHFLLGAHIVTQLLAFTPGNFPLYFWTIVTHPVAAIAESPLGLIFTLAWAYMFGGSIERSWGSRVFALFCVSVSAVSALSVWLGHFVFGPTILGGLWMVIGPAAVAWSIINAREVISFWTLPIPGPIWGLIGVAMVWYEAGYIYGNPLIGFCALTGCAVAYWYTKFGRYAYRGYASNPQAPLGGLRSGGFSGGNASGRGSDRNSRFQNFDQEGLPNRRRGLRDLNVFRWWRDRQERKRLEEIFRRSGLTEEEDDGAGEKRRPR